MLHPDDVAYFDRLKSIGFAVAISENILVEVIEPKRRPSTGTGLAYLSERRISIAVRGKAYATDGGAWSRNRYSHTYNLHTLAHELAHLQEDQIHGKTWHGPRFRVYESKLLELVTALDA